MILAGFVLLAGAGLSRGASGIWTNDASSVWSATTNWAGGIVADGTGSNADFSTINITASRTITLNSSRNLGNLLFGDISGSQNWFLNASGGSVLTLAVASGSPTIAVYNNMATLGLPLAGAAGLTKAGAGTLTLNGSAVNTYTGGTTLNAGTLVEDFSNLGATPNLINSGSTLTMGGSTLNMLGASISSSQAFNGTTFSAGGNVVSAAPVSGTIPTLTLGAVTDTTGGTVEFIGPAYASGASSGGTVGGTPVAATAMITTAAAGAGASGLLVSGNTGYATVNQYDWASTDTTGGTAGTSIIGGSQVAGFYTVQNGGTMAATAGNYDITASTTSGGGGTALISLRFNTAAAVTFSVRNNVNQTFSGALVTPNVAANNVTFTSATSSTGRGFNCNTANNLMFWQNNTSGELIFNELGSTVTYLCGGTASGSYIQNGPGTVSFIDSLGIWTTGGAFLNGGVTMIANNNELNCETTGSTVTLNGGTLVANYTGAMPETHNNPGNTPGPVALGNNGGGLGATAGNTFTIPNVISGAAGTGPLTIGIPASSANGNVVDLLPGTGTGTANPTPVYVIGNVTLTGANTYTGSTIICATNTLALSGSGTISTNSLSLAAGSTFDVSAIAAYICSNALIIASGNASPATLKGGTTVSLGSCPITLNYDGSHPALSVSQGTLSLNTNAFTVNGAVLPTGTYSVIRQASGSIADVGNYPPVTGTAIGTGTTGSIFVSGTNVNLLVSLNSPPAIPTVTNLPASNIAAATATLNGQVLSTGNQIPVVRVYYGTADGGSNPAAWTTNVSLGLQGGTYALAISNLVGNTSYYFTASASNSAGVAWASPSKSFTTAMLTLPTVTNLPASNVAATSATLNGQVLSAGGQTPVINVYYGTTNGGTNPAAWTTNVSLGLQGGTYTLAISNLVGNTSYYFAASASNATGIAWATPSKSFATLVRLPPVVTNLPASNVQGSSAVLNGQVVSIGVATPTVTLYYGTSNGGTNPAAWANNAYLGQQNGGYALTVTGLSTNTTYYYAAAAVNPDGIGWAQPSQSFTTLPTAPMVSVLTYHYDNTRQGANTSETVLTPANVNTNTFGKLFSQTVDGYVYAQPLVMPNVNIPGQGVHDVVFIATENDTVYAFDANGNGGANGGLLWSRHLGSPVDYRTVGEKPDGDLSPSNIGIMGTPVIDPLTGTLYVDTSTQTNSIYTHLIHALDVTTGNDRPYSPVVVAASVPGTASDGNGSILPFIAFNQMQRPAMTLAGGILYASYGSYQDILPYHGWIIGYNPTNLMQLTNYVFNTNPNNTQGSLWMGGGGLVVDANTNLYFETANGPYDPGVDFADSFMKLSTTNGLAIADYFTPSNQAAMQATDQDLGSGAPILLPDSAGSVAHPHLLVGAGKQGILYLIDRDYMGQYSTTTNSIVEASAFGTIGNSGGFNGSFDTPVYFNNRVYYTARKGNVKAFIMTNGVLVTSVNSKSPTSLGLFTSSAIVSANGTNNGIVWAIDPGAYTTQGATVLHAYNAANLGQELYNSSQLGTQPASRDYPGGAVKFAPPVVANGKVYVGTEMQFSVFGLNTFIAPPTIVPNGGSYANSQTVTLSDATSGSTIYYTLDGTMPTSSSTQYTGPFVITNSVSVQAIAVKSGSVNSAAAGASFINTAQAGDGIGLLGQYWTNTAAATFTNVSFNTPATLVQTDAVVNFNWAMGGPAANVGASNFTVRWTGMVQAQYNETYTFTTAANEGVRLWVNGQLLINNWADAATVTTNSGSITLAAQLYYNLQLDYYQKTNNASVALSWSGPSTAPAVIPRTQLYPFTNPPPTVILTSPANNSVYTASASVTLGADADAPYNPVSAVNFYANNNFLGSVTNIPYTLTATGFGAGSYALTAVAVDVSGLSNTSAPVNLTVNTSSGQPYGLTSNAPASAFLNMPPTYTGTLPPLLSGTGAFSDTPNRLAAGGLIPYVPNAPLWSDGAVKSRYLAVPNNGGTITTGEQIQFTTTNSWTFPAGTVFVKNFDLVINETNTSVPLRRLETRLLVRDINGAVYGVTYKWLPDNSDAVLLSNSLLENILITNATGVRTQTWYYPSPADCLTCHTPVANYVLGVNSRQLNNNQMYVSTGVMDNQLRTLNRLGLFNPAFDEASITNFEALSALTKLTASLQQRARSYLDANCAQCHQPGGTGITFDGRYDTALAQQKITNYPASFSAGISDNACIVRNHDIWRSVLLSRINTTNPSIAMPPLARNLIDTNAVQVFTDWINSLPGTPALAPPVITPNGGSFFSRVNVVLQAPDTNAAVYFTLDGSLPTTNSFLYAGAFALTTNATVSANAFETNYNNSVAASATFIIQPLYFTSSGFLTNRQFQLSFAGVTGSNYVLQATTNFSSWSSLSTNTAVTNFFNLLDPQATNFPFRFYRVLQQ